MGLESETKSRESITDVNITYCQVRGFYLQQQMPLCEHAVDLSTFGMFIMFAEL